MTDARGVIDLRDRTLVVVGLTYERCKPIVDELHGAGFGGTIRVLTAAARPSLHGLRITDVVDADGTFEWMAELLRCTDHTLRYHTHRSLVGALSGAAKVRW